MDPHAADAFNCQESHVLSFRFRDKQTSRQKHACLPSRDIHPLVAVFGDKEIVIRFHVCIFYGEVKTITEQG